MNSLGLRYRTERKGHQMQLRLNAWLIFLALNAVSINSCRTVERNVRGRHSGQEVKPIAPGESKLPGNGGMSPTAGDEPGTR